MLSDEPLWNQDVWIGGRHIFDSVVEILRGATCRKDCEEQQALEAIIAQKVSHPFEFMFLVGVRVKNLGIEPQIKKLLASQLSPFDLEKPVLN